MSKRYLDVHLDHPYAASPKETPPKDSDSSSSSSSSFSSLKKEAMSPPSETPMMLAISPKIPPLWTEDPAAWKSQCEAQFRIAGITSEATKYSYIVANMDKSHFAFLKDKLTCEPGSTAYTDLMAVILLRFTKSAAERMQLLHDVSLGDMTPTQMLRRMEACVPEEEHTSEMFRHTFLLKLTEDVRNQLAAYAKDSLSSLAEKADNILAFKKSASSSTNPFLQSIAAATTTSTVAPAVAASSQPTYAMVLQQQQQPQQQQGNPFLSPEYQNYYPDPTVGNFGAAQWNARGYVNRARGAAYRGQRSRGGRGFMREARGGYVCQYHLRFGKESRSCVGQCAMKPKNGNAPN